jgi:hypothetical protein
VGVSQPLRLLVDSRVHAEELARFEALVLRGPGVDDCAIWKGAIGGDGYDRLGTPRLRRTHHGARQPVCAGRRPGR